MLKKLFTISLIFATVTEIFATEKTEMTVEHGLFGRLKVIDHKEDIRAYNSWCKSQNQGIDDTDFLAKSCAEKCFEFDENSPDHFSRAEAEDLLMSVSKNPVAASAMKVLLSKYIKYDENVLSRCALTKSPCEEIAYSCDEEPYEPSIITHSINLHTELTGNKQLILFINYQEPARYSPSLVRQLTHEMMHFMDFIVAFDAHKLGCFSNIGIEKCMSFLDAQTVKSNIIENVEKITEAEISLGNKGFSLKEAIKWVYDDSVESQGMFGVQLVQYKKRYYLGGILSGTVSYSYKFAYEPINDAMSHLYGFESDDEFVGKIRLNHKKDDQLLPVAPILENHFHIYSFYKQDDVKQAFEFSTKAQL